MINNYVFHLNEDSNEIIKKFELKKILSNNRTSIYQNDEMRFSFDKNVVRVLTFDDNENMKEKLYRYFYGKQYEQIRN